MTNTRFLRIHGDNILECERTLRLLSEALGAPHISLRDDTPIFKPCYSILTNGGQKYEVELLAGYDRWGIPITKEILSQGGILKETPDSYLTEIVDGKETVLLGIEYSSALPAGNNAWQRNGRGYSCAMAGIPYLYIAEIGGVELDSETREIKAPRFPNPLVPFSYVSITKRNTICCLPVYMRHPSISQKVLNDYREILADSECIDIIRCILHHESYSQAMDSLSSKALKMVAKRSNKGTLQGEDWQKYLNAQHPCDWICKNMTTLKWKKKASAKVKTSSAYKRLRSELQNLDCLTIGSKDMPICVIQSTEVNRFSCIVRKCYPQLRFRLAKDRPVVIVWITGFKPKGEDSRPDRGLNPLTRMIIGEDATILSVVSGPTSIPATQDSKGDNGLWASVLSCSDYAIQDSINLDAPILLTGNRKYSGSKNPPSFPYRDSRIQVIGEQDIDTTIHQLFVGNEDIGIYEGLCNPPGGDWSGISYWGKDMTEYRWTSLPRVSELEGKRPDHFIQVRGRCSDILLTIESKGKAMNLEPTIGTRLKHYINVLFDSPVTARRPYKKEWETNVDGSVRIKKYQNLSVGAFEYSQRTKLQSVLSNKGLDAVMAFEYASDRQTILHVSCTNEAAILVKLLKKICRRKGNIVIQVD